MAKQRRVYRVAERLREVLATHLLDLTDPRLQLVTISSVIISSDLMEAKVYWQTFNSTAERIKEVAAGFESAQGLLRKCVAQELRLRFVPHLNFIYDDTLDVSEKVQRLVERARQMDHKE